jgi:hypothetical protein
VGIVAVVLLVLVLAGSVAGLWNPWHYVILREHFGNPLADLASVILLVAAAIWLLAPVRNEAGHNSRVNVRWAAVAAFLLTAICFGGFGRAFDPGQTRTVGSLGDLRLVVETRGEDSDLHIWAGSGWTVRDMGRIGKACGEVSGTFNGRGEVLITTVYGSFRIPLDPATGRPLAQLGPTCSG